MKTQIIKFVNKSDNPNPEYASNESSGFDLRAWITEEDEGSRPNFNGSQYIILKPFERRMVHTGIYMELPENVEVQVRPRSGMAIKKGLTVINTPGTVDCDYVNEVCVLLINLDPNNEIFINSGDRIAQAVLMPVYNAPLVKLIQMADISRKNDRGGGFGHTGVK